MNPIAKAVDKFSPLTAADAKALKASGVSAVGRYLTGEGKALTPAEVSIITSAGLSILSVYETNPTYRSYFTHAQGVSDAKAAVNAAQTLKQPSGTPIYFAVDFDCQDSDMQTIRDYFDGVRSAIGGYKVGLYGGLRAVSNVAADFYWQTCAWSPSISPRAAIYQSQVDVAFSGLHVDINDIYKPCGMWPAQKETEAVSYPKVKVQINGEAFDDGYAVNNTTYVKYTALNKVGTAYTHPGYGVLNISGKDVRGVVFGGDTYVPWSVIAPKVQPVHIDGGWNFVTHTDESVAGLGTLLETYQGDVMNDAFYFAVKVNDGGIAHICLDTGAFELLVPKGIADALGFPNLGDTTINGVSGQAQAYNSKCDIHVGSAVFKDQPCVVQLDWPFYFDGLFGADFFIKNGLTMVMDWQKGQLSIYKPN